MDAFQQWAHKASIITQRILEPFAGQNALIDALHGMGMCHKFRSFDLFPASDAVEKQDTLANFPQGYSVCITNPPWLAKNSATARGIQFPDTYHDDLYKFALEKCLENCEWVAALIPESFIRANLFHERLTDFISLTGKMFDDTGHPVGLALFQPEKSYDVMVWQNSEEIGFLSKLEELRPKVQSNRANVRFNDPEGNVGLIALDSTMGPSIRFCEADALAGYNVKNSGRHITKISYDGKILLEAWNDCLNSFRDKTRDVLLTCYKGIRKDGQYRRRLDWETARGIMNHAQ